MIQPTVRYWVVPVLLIFSASCANSAKKVQTSQPRSRETLSSMQVKSPLSQDQALMQELTGKAVSHLPTAQQLKGKPLSTQHYYAGLRAAEEKNYIMAIKHFNTVLKKYPRSFEVKKAFAAKAQIYNEMGLNQPAELNLRLSNQPAKPVLTRKTASNQISPLINSTGKTKNKR